jgi:hypothetical protein
VRGGGRINSMIRTRANVQDDKRIHSLERGQSAEHDYDHE